MARRTILLLGGLLAAAGLALAGAHAQARGADGGKEMAMPSRPTLAVSAVFDGAGRLWLARVENGTLLVSHSDDGGQNFSAPVAVNPAPENIGAEGENRPKIAVAGNGTIHLSWTLLLPQPYTGEVRYSRSTDGGRTFSVPVTLNDDGRLSSHRFDSLIVDGGGRLAVVWLDGRDRDAAREKGEKFSGVSLYAARSDDDGAHFRRNEKITAHTCECCRTALAWTKDGPVALWRNLYGTNVRDFALAKLDGGEVRRLADDDWAIDACPHHGGGLAGGADGVLHAVWYTQGKNRQGLFYRRIEGDTLSAPMAFGNAQAQAGHATVAAAGDKALIAWREFDGNAYGAMVLQSGDNGKSWGAARRIAATEGAADYPLPLIHNGRAHVLWHTRHHGVRVIALD